MIDTLTEDDWTMAQSADWWDSHSWGVEKEGRLHL